MRKIVYNISMDRETFAPYLVIKMRDENGTVTELFKEEITQEAENKYTPEQQAKINQVNMLLGMNGQPPMTEEECEFMFDPHSYKAYMNTELEEEKLQRLAGFKVEKKITYFDDFHKES